MVDRPIFRHWTAAFRVPLILKSGLIRTTESNCSPISDHAGPPVVWLLPNTVDVGTGQDHGLHDQKRDGWIDVDIPAIRWVDWGHTAFMEPTWRSTMIEAGGGPEMAAQWYVFPAAILRRCFVAASNRWTP